MKADSVIRNGQIFCLLCRFMGGIAVKAARRWQSARTGILPEAETVLDAEGNPVLPEWWIPTSMCGTRGTGAGNFVTETAAAAAAGGVTPASPSTLFPRLPYSPEGKYQNRSGWPLPCPWTEAGAAAPSFLDEVRRWPVIVAFKTFLHEAPGRLTEEFWGSPWPTTGVGSPRRFPGSSENRTHPHDPR